MKVKPGQTRHLAKEKEKEEYIWSVEEKKNREGKGDNILQRKISGYLRRRRTEEENEENVWRRKILGWVRRKRTKKEKKEIIRRRKSDDWRTNSWGLDLFFRRGRVKSLFALQSVSDIVNYWDALMRLLNTRDINLQPKCVLIVAASIYQTDKTFQKV